MTKRKRNKFLDVLPDRYTARIDAIQPSLQTQIAQIQREASEKQKQLDYYLNGSNYIVRPDQNGNLTVYMGDNEEPVPQEFIPRLRQSNRYIDMAFTPITQNQTYISQGSNKPISDYERRNRERAYYHQVGEQALDKVRQPIRRGVYGTLDLANEGILKNPAVQVLGYAVSPSTYINLASTGLNKISGWDTDDYAKPLGTVLDAGMMFMPISAAGKLRDVTENIMKAREYISGLQKAGQLKITATSLTKIQNALAALEKNPKNITAINSLRAQLSRNPELVADLQSAKLFDGMEEFNQMLQPFKIDQPLVSSYVTNSKFVQPRKPSYEEMMGRILPENRGITHNGQYWRSTGGKGYPQSLKEGDWFLDENNQMHRIISRDGKLTDLLDSDFATQRRTQIAKETEAKIKEAEQRGRDSLQKELDEARAKNTPEPEVTPDEPKKYAYLPLSNGKTVTLEINGNTAVDPITGSTFELYPGTTRVKQMEYTPNPSFYNEYGKGAYGPDGNPAKWKPRSAWDPRTWIQQLYSKAGNPDNPQHLISNYGVWDFANKNKKLMNNTREFSHKRAWGFGIGAGLVGAGIISQKGLWGVGKAVGTGAADAGGYILFGKDNPVKQESTKQDTQQQSDSQPVDTMNAWGVNDMDAQLDSLRQVYQ